MKRSFGYLHITLTVALLLQITIASGAILIDNADTIWNSSNIPASEDIIDSSDASPQHFSNIFIINADTIWNSNNIPASEDVISSSDALPQNLSNIFIINADTIWNKDLMAPDSPTPPPSEIQDKSLLQVEGQLEVYWLQNDRLYWVTDWNVINDMSAVPGWNSINTLPASEFGPADYEQGPRFINTGAESDGLLIRQVGDYKVYRIENGMKRHITYPDVMDLKGYSFDDVIEVSSEISNMFQIGEPIGIEVDLYFNKLTGLVESPHESQFTIGDTIKFITETTAGEDYTVETYVRLTYPDGITKKYAYHEKSDLSDPLKFSETESAFYPGTWNTQTKTWNWNEYTFAGDETEGIYIWEFWYKDTASGKILGKDVQGYEFSITPPDPIDITPPKIILLPVLGTTTDGITYYNSYVYVSGTAFDPSGIKTLTVNGRGLWSIPVYGVKVFGSFINLNEGINEITISAIDNSENSNEKVEKVNINYYPYNVKINSPKDGSVFKEGDSIKLEGKVTGGTPQFDYEWLINGVVENSGTSDNGLIEHTFNGLALGEYNVKLKVTDFEGYVFETNEMQIFVKEPKPDLIVTDISFSKKYPSEGEPITVTARIKNVGPVNVNKPFWLNFDQSSHYTTESNEIGFDALIGRERIDQLAIGESKDITISWNAAPVKTDRDGSIRLFIDSIEEIDEIDEYNNIKYGKITITNRADFKPEEDGYSFKNFDPSESEEQELFFSVKNMYDWSTEFALFIPFGAISDIMSLITKGALCYGMSSTSILYFTEDVSKPINEETFLMPESDKTVRSNLIRYQSIQFAPLVFKKIINDLSDHSLSIEDEYNKIKKSVEKGRPVICNIDIIDTGPHSVVAYNIYESGSTKNVIVYDPNYPGMARVIKFDFNENKITYSSYNYTKNKMYDSQYLSTFNAIASASDGKSLLHEMKNVIVQTLSINKLEQFNFYCPINVTIRDQYGRIIDSKGINNIPKAQFSVFGDTKTFLVPEELDYTIEIEAYDKGNFSFTQLTPLSENSISLTLHENIAINTKSKALIEVNSGDLEPVIKIDYDGDGVIDEIKEPDTVQKIILGTTSITNLQSASNSIWINWTWTNPPDSNFNHTEIYLNGIFQTNTSAEFFNATGLIPNTEYTISTKTVDNLGNINETWVNDTAMTLDTPPVSNASGPYTGKEGQAIIFNASASYDPDPGDSIASFEWDFNNDGATDATGMEVSWTWNDDHTGQVNLTVTDSHGESSTDTTSVNVLNAPPEVEAGNDQTVNEGDTVNFTGDFTDPGTGDTHTIEWDFGDGTPGSTGTLEPTHVYADNGTYTITLTVTDDDGASTSDTLNVTVENVAPIVDAGVDQIANEGDIVSFAGNFTDPGTADTHLIEWDFGDGTPISSGTLTAIHTYADNGTYTVNLTVTDDDGASTSDTLIVTVNNVAPVLDECADETVQWGDTMTLSRSFTDPGDDSWTAEINWGDGSQEEGILSSKIITATHVYSIPGEYICTLTVLDDDGGVGSGNMQITVTTRATELKYIGDLFAQYSDYINLKAQLNDPGNDSPLPDRSINFTLGTQTATATTGPDGIATTSFKLDQPAGSYDIKAEFAGDDSYSPDNDTKAMQISREDAKITYTGDTILPTTAGSIDLRATLEEIDTDYGDLTEINVNFNIYKSSDLSYSNPIATTPSIASISVTSSGMGVGTATATIDNLPEDDYMIIARIVPNNYYLSISSNPTPMIVYEPTDQFTTGGGWIWDPTGSHGNFGFNVKYNKNGKVKGNSIYVYRLDELDYIVKSNAWIGLAISDNTSTFQGKAVLQIFDPVTGELQPESSGNFQFTVEAMDNELNGNPDYYRITVLDKEGLEYHNATGSLEGGNIVIHDKKSK